MHDSWYQSSHASPVPSRPASARQPPQLFRSVFPPDDETHPPPKVKPHVPDSSAIIPNIIDLSPSADESFGEVEQYPFRVLHGTYDHKDGWAQSSRSASRMSDYDDGVEAPAREAWVPPSLRPTTALSESKEKEAAREAQAARQGKLWGGTGMHNDGRRDVDDVARSGNVKIEESGPPGAKRTGGSAHVSSSAAHQTASKSSAPSASSPGTSEPRSGPRNASHSTPGPGHLPPEFLNEVQKHPSFFLPDKIRDFMRKDALATTTVASRSGRPKSAPSKRPVEKATFLPRIASQQSRPSRLPRWKSAPTVSARLPVLPRTVVRGTRAAYERESLEEFLYAEELCKRDDLSIKEISDRLDRIRKHVRVDFAGVGGWTQGNSGSKDGRGTPASSLGGAGSGGIFKERSSVQGGQHSTKPKTNGKIVVPARPVTWGDEWGNETRSQGGAGGSILRLTPGPIPSGGLSGSAAQSQESQLMRSIEDLDRLLSAKLGRLNMVKP
ncbi:hypothetical protein HK104_001346 [Borealophlyctis nickersoniae]|nr:hypothetical protein HK104_001346 [Borealophlyctis nickersoniae]